MQRLQEIPRPRPNDVAGGSRSPPVRNIVLRVAAFRDYFVYFHSFASLIKSARSSSRFPSVRYRLNFRQPQPSPNSMVVGFDINSFHEIAASKAWRRSTDRGNNAALHHNVRIDHDPHFIAR